MPQHGPWDLFPANTLTASPCALSTVLNTLPVKITHLVLTTILWTRCAYYLHFAVEETEAEIKRLAQGHTEPGLGSSDDS